MHPHRRDCEARKAKWGGDYRVEYTVRPAPQQKSGRWYIVAAWKMMDKAPGRDSFFPVFESGDAADPQWLDVGAVATFVKLAGVEWK